MKADDLNCLSWSWLLPSLLTNDVRPQSQPASQLGRSLKNREGAELVCVCEGGGSPTRGSLHEASRI